MVDLTAEEMANVVRRRIPFTSAIDDGTMSA
jgi:hypothetical protein